MLAFGLLFCFLLNLSVQETFDSNCASYVVSVKERGRRWISGTYNFLESNGTRPSFKHESKDLYLWYRSEGSEGGRWLISNGKRRNSAKYPGLIWAETTTDMPSTELEWRRIVKTMDTDGNVFMTSISDINVSIGCVGCVESSQICFDNIGIILNPGETLPCCSGLTCASSPENYNIGKCTDPSVVVSTTSPTCLREEQTCFDPATIAIEDFNLNIVLDSCCSGMICTPTPEMTFTFSDGNALPYGVCRAPTNGVDKENGECFDLRKNEAYICPNGQTCVFRNFAWITECVDDEWL